jgi:hypothetical protein
MFRLIGVGLGFLRLLSALQNPDSFVIPGADESMAIESLFKGFLSVGISCDASNLSGF